jgi:DNA helicase-2/ATP-dependent DNA helicase PcrA
MSTQNPSFLARDRPEYLKDLNPAQLEAALCTEGPLLILAGAGAGKTKTVTYRILHLIKTGVSPRNILAITFTNKAAREMRERVTDLLNSDQNFNLPMHAMHDGDRPFVSTFHSLGVNILKESGHKLGINRHFVIYDRGDSKQTVKDALIELGHDPKQIDPNKILGIISREKGNFTSREEYEAKNGDDYMGSIASEVWRKYDAKLEKDKALDFDDLLFKTAHLLSTHADVREYYQNKWKYVHVDEYQDTNQVQYRLVQLLVDKHRNLAVVGDGDQSIYGFRGADIKNILKFEEDYPEAKAVLLEQNYRSTQTILTAANKVIEKNIYRKKKNLFTKNEEGEKIKYIPHTTKPTKQTLLQTPYVNYLIRALLMRKEIKKQSSRTISPSSIERTFNREQLRILFCEKILPTRFWVRSFLKEKKSKMSFRI